MSIQIDFVLLSKLVGMDLICNISGLCFYHHSFCLDWFYAFSENLILLLAFF